MSDIPDVPYNNTAWNSDTPHIARTAVSCSIGSIIFLATICIAPLVFFRMSKFPLKAHGRFFQFQKILSVLFISAFFICFMFLNKLWMSLFLIFIPYASLYPTLLRCWNIYHTLRATLIKTQINSNADTQSLLSEAQHKEMKRTKIFTGIPFLAFFTSGFFLIHLVLFIICFPIFYTKHDKICLFYAISAGAIAGVVYGIMILIICIQLIRVKLRENFHILEGVFGNLVMILLTVSLVGYYAAALIASAFVTDWYAGYIVYATFIPIDVLLLVLLLVDLIISTLVPTIHTFFWKSASQQSQSDEIEAILADKEAIEDFKAFSAKEFSLENIVFYEQYLKLKDTPQDKLTLITYAELYNAFIKENASLQLNLDYKVSQSWKRAIDAKNSEELFAALNKTVDATKTNMQDTLSRFQLTEEYRKFFTRHSTFKSLGWQEKQKVPEQAVDPSKRRTKSRARSVIEFFIGTSDAEQA